MTKEPKIEKKIDAQDSLSNKTKDTLEFGFEIIEISNDECSRLAGFSCVCCDAVPL